MGYQRTNMDEYDHHNVVSNCLLLVVTALLVGCLSKLLDMDVITRLDLCYQIAEFVRLVWEFTQSMRECLDTQFVATGKFAPSNLPISLST